MNAKHLACVILFAVVIGLFQGTMMLNQRMLSAMESAQDARARHDTASSKHNSAKMVLDAARVKTAAHRKYLEMWRPKFFEQSATADIQAKNEFGRMLKRFPNLEQFMFQTSAPVENKDMTFVNRRVTSSVKLEGDAEKAVQLLSSIERELPTGRISSMEIRKGQRGNDIELDLSVEFPLLAAPPVDPEKKP
jgi:hypothetical protein